MLADLCDRLLCFFSFAAGRVLRLGGLGLRAGDGEGVGMGLTRRRSLRVVRLSGLGPGLGEHERLGDGERLGAEREASFSVASEGSGSRGISKSATGSGSRVVEGSAAG